MIDDTRLVTQKQPDRRKRFESQQPVRWLTPSEIAAGGFGEFFGGLFAKFADARDRIDLLREARVQDLPSPPAEAIVDYVADVGDGFGPTYAVANAIADPTICGNKWNERLADQQQRLLVFGGDQVYPVADREEYRNRTLGPYNFAFDGAGQEAQILAIPGNHDWYDGLSAFLDSFTVTKPGDQDPGNDAFTRTQTRSYFARRVSEHWWIWGIDVGLDNTRQIPAGQADYFATARLRLKDDDNVILCVAEPVWLKRVPDDDQTTLDAWDQLVSFLWAVFAGSPWARIRLILTGDKHFYAHHQPVDTTDPAPRLVTAGGGGAYLSSTADAVDTVELGMQPERERGQQVVRFDAKKRWPDRTESRRIGWWGGLLRVPTFNPGFNAIFSVIYGLAAYFILTGWRRPSFVEQGREIPDTLDSMINFDQASGIVRTMLVGPFVTLGGLLFILAVITGVMAHGNAAGKRHGARKWLAGIFHLALHAVGLVGIGVLVAWLVVNEPLGIGHIQWSAILFAVALAVLVFPEAFSAYVFQVAEWRQIFYLAPLALVLVLLLTADAADAETQALAFVTGTAIMGGGLGAVIFGFAFAALQNQRIGLNELFAGIRHTGHKHFVRVEINDRTATVYTIGLRRTKPMSISWSEGTGTLTGIRESVPGFLREWLETSTPTIVDEFTIGSSLDLQDSA